jgi:hypothetical protein
MKIINPCYPMTTQTGNTPGAVVVVHGFVPADPLT